MARKYKWQMRKQLVEYLRAARGGRLVDIDGLVEMLTDLRRSGSCMASEATAAIFDASDKQLGRLWKDVTK